MREADHLEARTHQRPCAPQRILIRARERRTLRHAQLTSEYACRTGPLSGCGYTEIQMTQEITTHREERVQGTKDITLFVRSWRPAQARGVVAIVPGFNAHSGYY